MRFGEKVDFVFDVDETVDLKGYQSAGPDTATFY